MYLEDGSPDRKIEAYLTRHSIPEVSRVAPGTLWPSPRVYHLPADKERMADLAGIVDRHAGPELPIHFHLYRQDTVLLH